MKLYKDVKMKLDWGKNPIHLYPVNGGNGSVSSCPLS